MVLLVYSIRYLRGSKTPKLSSLLSCFPTVLLLKQTNLCYDISLTLIPVLGNEGDPDILTPNMLLGIWMVLRRLRTSRCRKSCFAAYQEYNLPLLPIKVDTYKNVSMPDRGLLRRKLITWEMRTCRWASFRWWVSSPVIASSSHTCRPPPQSPQTLFLLICIVSVWFIGPSHWI